jgi:hypothetical protein
LPTQPTLGNATLLVARGAAAAAAAAARLTAFSAEGAAVREIASRLAVQLDANPTAAGLWAAAAVAACQWADAALDARGIRLDAWDADSSSAEAAVASHAPTTMTEMNRRVERHLVSHVVSIMPLFRLRRALVTGAALLGERGGLWQSACGWSEGNSQHSLHTADTSSRRQPQQQRGSKWASSAELSRAFAGVIHGR